MQYRHMTAKEMALLNGLSPETPLGDDGRLALALVGQIASPLQSCWVFAQLRRAVGPDAGSVNPIQLLTQQRWELLRAAERCGLRSIPASGLSADGDVAQTPCGADAVTLPAPLVRTGAPRRFPWPLPRATSPSFGAVCCLRCKVPSCPGLVAGVFLSGVDCGLSAWRLRTVDGVVIQPAALLLPGQTVIVDLAGVPSDDALHAKVDLADAHRLIQARVDAKVREDIALEQAPWLTDDQVAWALRELASHATGTSVWVDPVVLTASVQAATPSILPRCRFQCGGVLIAAALLGGHWVSFCWHNVGGAVRAWTSASSVEHSHSVAVVHWLFAGSAGLDLEQFRFKDAPARFLDPGLCGHAAVLDLRTRLFGTRPVDDVDVSGHAARAHDCYLNDVLREATARQPCLIGGVVGSMIEHGLSCLLKTKGVPEAHALARAKEVLQKVGHASVQEAMVSSQPWRQLKSLCSKLQPPVQLVLPVELQAQIARKIEAGEEVRPKRKTKAAKDARDLAGSSKVTLPTPDLVEVPEGVFVSGGRNLVQINPAQIGPAASGIVLMTLSDAEPYVCISKPLSSGPLGLLVLGDLPTDLVQVVHSVERFQARWKLSGDPLLLQATLLQIGAQPVTKFVPAECTPVDVLPSALVRVAVFRDEWGQPWADFVKAPLRAVVAQCKLLTSCSVAGCTCEAFHGVSGPGEPEPILEVFGRQFLQLNLRQATPGEAHGIRHRVWECPGLATAREQAVTPGTPDLAFLPECQLLHAWAMRPGKQFELWRVLCLLPSSIRPFELHAPRRAYDLFTDGTCLLPSQPQVRLAAWAVTLAREDSMPPFVLNSGLLPGLIQTSFRAEIFAVLAAVRFCRLVGAPVRIWCDCLGVVRRVRKLLRGSNSFAANIKNGDLWSCLREETSGLENLLDIQKVPAHEELQDDDDAVTEWLLTNNADVDAAARAANLARGEAFWELWEEVRKDRAYQTFVGRAVLKMHGAIGVVASRRDESRFQAVERDFQPRPEQAMTLGSQDVSADGAFARRYGARYQRELSDWLSHFVYHPICQQAPLRWISILQLLCSFVLETGRRPPFFDSASRTWYEPDDRVRGHLITVEARKLATWFGRSLRAFVIATGGNYHSEDIRPDSAALQIKLRSIPCQLEPCACQRVEELLARRLPGGVCSGRSTTWASIRF